ncbi:MAG: TIGR04086 family membrane protein [Clostridia bacterium]
MTKNKLLASGKSKTNKKELSTSTIVFIKTQILFLNLNIIALIISIYACLQLDLARSNIFYASIVSLAFGSFFSSFYAGYKIHKNGLVTGFLFCLPINVLMILISMITNSFEIDLTALIAFFILVVVSMLGGIISVNITMKAKKKTRR